MCPKPVKVKICGITNKEDAVHAVESGCDAIGFIFYKKSPRYIAPEAAQEIISHLSDEVVKIGVFVNAREKTVRRIAGLCRLNVLQFHGRETPAFCRRFKRYKIIKAFRLRNELDARMVSKYDTFAYLFDTYSDNQLGGTGKKFNWKLIRHIGPLRSPIFLSGGLNEENVKHAILCVSPDWVDASSCLESAPGKKDRHKVKRFIHRVKCSS